MKIVIIEKPKGFTTLLRWMFKIPKIHTPT